MAYTSINKSRVGRTLWRRLMEDIKWLFRKCGIPILIVLIMAITRIVIREQKGEKVWKPPIEIENSKITEKSENEEDVTESAHRVIPKSSDCLISK